MAMVFPFFLPLHNFFRSDALKNLPRKHEYMHKHVVLQLALENSDLQCACVCEKRKTNVLISLDFTFSIFDVSLFYGFGIRMRI